MIGLADKPRNLATVCWWTVRHCTDTGKRGQQWPWAMEKRKLKDWKGGHETRCKKWPVLSIVLCSPFLWQPAVRVPKHRLFPSCSELAKLRIGNSPLKALNRQLAYIFIEFLKNLPVTDTSNQYTAADLRTICIYLNRVHLSTSCFCVRRVHREVSLFVIRP